MRGTAKRFRRGLTLLELLVSLVIIASVTTLVAALWGQLAAWSRVQSTLHDVIATSRFEDAAWSQWVTRISVGGTERTPGRRIVSMRDDELSFVTPKPILSRDASLVLATYRVNRDRDGAVSLVYIEQALAHANTPPLGDLDGLIVEGSLLPRTMIAIDEADNLQWEMWVDRFEDDERIRGWFPITEDDVLAGDDLDPSDVEDDSRRQATNQRASDPAPGQLDDGSGASDENAEDDKPRAPRSVRLVGKIDGRDFAWLFSDDASR